MDLSLHPTPVSEYNKQMTGARFTVRSANSPSYSLTRRPGVRKPRGFSEEEREGTEEIRERARYDTGNNSTNKEKDPTATGHQDRTGSCSSVKGHREGEETSGHKMSTKLNQNCTSDKIITEVGFDKGGNCNPASESRGRTDFRRYNMTSRSKSLDWRTRERSPDWGKRADMLSTKKGVDISKWAGDLVERGPGVEGMKGRVMSSIHAYNSAGAYNDGREKNIMSHMSQTLDKTSRGHSLPSRLRSQSGSGSGDRGTVTSFGSKGSQSIQERIEKLFGSAGFSKTEDYKRIKDFSTPVTSLHKETTTDFLIMPQRRSCERAAGATFPRQLSLGESLSPVQSRKSLTWTQKDTSIAESYLASGTNRTRQRFSSGPWQGQTQGRCSEEGGVHRRRGLEDIGTRSLDRNRRRCPVAAQIRAARAGGRINVPQSNPFLEEEGSFSLRDSSGWRETRASGSKDQIGVIYGEEIGKTNGINGTLREGWFKEQEKEKEIHEGAKENTELQSSRLDEDVFELVPQKITLRTIERKKFPEMLSVPSAASVKNKINQFEALTQRSQSLASGQILMARRAFSVPTQLSKAHDGVKKSGSARAVSCLRDKWEGLKAEKETGEKSEEETAGVGNKFGSERSLSVDEVALNLGRKEREAHALVEGKERDNCNNSSADFKNYSRLKCTLEFPTNVETQRPRRNFCIDEMDFCKVSSPEEASDRRLPSVVSNNSDSSISVPKTTPSAASDEDKTPTNTPNRSPLLSPTTQPGNNFLIAASENKSTSVFMQATRTPEQDSSPPPCPVTTLSHSNLPDLIVADASAASPNRKKQVLNLDAWVADLSTKTKDWNDDEDDYEDDDESTQKDEDSNYDSDSGESSVTITSNMSQSDRKSFCVSLSDLCNFAGVDYESESESDEWQSTGRRSASLSSDMSALSYVSVLPCEELDRLLEDVRSLGDSNLQDYNDVQVVVLHKEVGVGLGFSVAGGVDQNKPITVHKVFHSGVAAQEGSIREGDQVLSINGTSLCGFLHWEALRVLRRAKTRELGVVVLRRGGVNNACKGATQTDDPGLTQTQCTETGQCMCVCLEKNSRDLGFSLEGGVGTSQENRPLTVQKIFQGGPVDKVCPGDEVLEIEGVSMVGMRRLEAWTLIRRLPPGPVNVVLRRPLKLGT